MTARSVARAALSAPFERSSLDWFETCSSVDLVEAQCDHFTAAHAVNGKQQQNSAIPNIPRPVRVGVRQHALHIGPIGRVW